MQRSKIIRPFLALILGIVLLLPTPASAAELYFTSVNDNLLPLTSETMPVWSGGVLYVPYTVFDGRFTGVDLHLYCSYVSGSSTLSITSLKQTLDFDIAKGTARDEKTGTIYSARVILRNGIPYLPPNVVCNFFGLSSSYTVIPQGYLLRIKSDAVVLSDAKFIDAASDLINRRVKEYTQSLSPPTAPPSTTTPPSVDDDSPTDVRTYLAFCYEDAASTTAILDALALNHVYALFFFSPQALQEQGDLVRRILGTGHSIGLLAEGETADQTQALLEQGNRMLEQIALTRTWVALVGQDKAAALQANGWTIWNQTLALTPIATSGANTFASNTLQKLEGRTQSAYLTLTANPHTARVLPALLRQLALRHFVVSIPMETRL